MFGLIISGILGGSEAIRAHNLSKYGYKSDSYDEEKRLRAMVVDPEKYDYVWSKIELFKRYYPEIVYHDINDWSFVGKKRLNTCVMARNIEKEFIPVKREDVDTTVRMLYVVEKRTGSHEE